VAAAGFPEPVSSVNLAPIPRRPRPTLTESGDLELAGGAGPASDNGGPDPARRVASPLVSARGMVAEIVKNGFGSTTLYQFTVQRNSETCGCSSRINWRKSIRAVSVEDHELPNPLPRERHRDIAEQQRLRAGFMLMAQWMSSWPVIHPKRHAGSTTTLAPRCHARSARARRGSSDWMLSVP